MEPKKLRSGRYELLGKLGAGSQGETFEAIDHGSKGARPLAEQWKTYLDRGGKQPPGQSKTRVAIKCFRVSQASSWKDVELAEREATTLASLSHPGLPQYLEHFEEDGALYLVMQKMEGESLAAIRTRKGRMSTDEVTRMLRDVAAALRYLHGLAPPVVHRDIKPGNVIRRPDGSFAIVDFGAVRDRLKHAGGSTVVGTFGFMAPEQFQGRAGTKSDVYGAAATAVAMLTGEEPEELPHDGLAIDVERALPASTPKSLVFALVSMLRPNPDDRAASIDEALDATAATAGGTRKPRHAAAPKQALRQPPWSAPIERIAGIPLPVRIVARMGLLLATALVTLAVGVLVPIFFTLLSLIFGAPLRRASAACMVGADKARASMRRASQRLAFEPVVRLSRRQRRAAAAVGRVRVALTEDRVPVPAEEADNWLEGRLERENEGDVRAEPRHAPARPKGKHWGR